MLIDSIIIVSLFVLFGVWKTVVYFLQLSIVFIFKSKSTLLLKSIIKTYIM